MTEVQRIAAFCDGAAGGNPAGVVIAAHLPDPAEMQRIAADVGYSETAFAAPSGDGFRVRYFAPEGEVPFCGHATIALGAALGAAHGAGRHALHLNHARISVTAERAGTGWGARLLSPATSHQPADPGYLERMLGLFGWGRGDLDATLPPALVEAGARHLLIPLASHAALSAMRYDMEAGAVLMKEGGLTTILLAHRAAGDLVFARNAFAAFGVYEDPATGAAAAALGGYLRDAGISSEPFTIRQGAEMGAPSVIRVASERGRGTPVAVSGLTRPI